MFSQTVEYALRAVVFMAGEPDRPMTTQEIAQHTLVPRGYLSKVLQYLSRAGLVTAQRGLHGGYCLTRSPQQITVLDVVNAVDPVQRIHTCPLGIEMHGKNLCPLHRRLDQALAFIEKAFGESTIADVLDEPSQSKPLCRVNPDGSKKQPA